MEKKHRERLFNWSFNDGYSKWICFRFRHEKGAQLVKKENKRLAEIIGIKPAARTTTVKPAGTTSLTLELHLEFTLGIMSIILEELELVKMKLYIIILSIIIQN